jgi:hypothetical protein
MTIVNVNFVYFGSMNRTFHNRIAIEELLLVKSKTLILISIATKALALIPNVWLSLVASDVTDKLDFVLAILFASVQCNEIQII